MKGNNKLIFCAAQMYEAIEWYLNTIIFDNDLPNIKVTSVDHDYNACEFTISITDDDRGGMVESKKSFEES